MAVAQHSRAGWWACGAEGRLAQLQAVTAAKSAAELTRPVLFFSAQEAKRFDGIDAAWKKVMAETSRNPVVLEACGAEGRLAQLQALSEQLEACQKSLSEYIELKRCAFTRCVS